MVICRLCRRFVYFSPVSVIPAFLLASTCTFPLQEDGSSLAELTRRWREPMRPEPMLTGANARRRQTKRANWKRAKGGNAAKGADRYPRAKEAKDECEEQQLDRDTRRCCGSPLRQPGRASDRDRVDGRLSGGAGYTPEQIGVLAHCLSACCAAAPRAPRTDHTTPSQAP
jgi:hypothetical protein